MKRIFDAIVSSSFFFVANHVYLIESLSMKNLLLLILLAACSHTPKTHKSEAVVAPPVKDIVLIQGVHLDDSSWSEINSRLTSQNFKVTTLNRLGRDTPPVSLKTIATLSCEQVPAHSIIVAHSFGGAITNAMVGICPAKIDKIIYVSAVIPLNGELPFHKMSTKDQKAYAKAVDFNSTTITPKSAKTFFKVTDGTYKFDAKNAPKLYSESMNLAKGPVSFDMATFNAIAKFYIYTERDAVVSVQTQELYASRAGIKNTSGVETGHFPMFSDPESLTAEILKWAK